MTIQRLFHISENPSITKFYPRPSPSFFKQVKADVVFAINDKLLHNYFFPRDCPRIAFYKKEGTTQEDIFKFLGTTSADYIIATESSWYPNIKRTTLYCYEFPVDSFILLDDCAGYYISYQPVVPLFVRELDDLIGELTSRNIELRFTPDLWKLADSLSASTLNFSMIRMKNASPRE